MPRLQRRPRHNTQGIQRVRLIRLVGDRGASKALIVIMRVCSQGSRLLCLRAKQPSLDRADAETERWTAFRRRIV